MGTFFGAGVRMLMVPEFALYNKPVTNVATSAVMLYVVSNVVSIC
jgi:hypothetical protein